MTTIVTGHEPEMRHEEITGECAAQAAEESALAGEHAEDNSFRQPLPWIGALPNPRLGPMVVVNDGGYLVPLCTVGDLVRGCRYFWRRTLD